MTPEPPTDASSLRPPTPPRGSRRRVRGLVVCTALLLAVAVAVALWMRKDERREVVAVEGATASLVFTDPDIDSTDLDTVTSGRIELRDPQGEVEWVGHGRMVVGTKTSDTNRLEVTAPNRWAAPFGTNGLNVEAPKVATSWNARRGAFSATVTGRASGATAKKLQPAAVQRVVGPDGTSAALPAAPAPKQTVTVDLGRAGAPTVRTTPVDLGPLDLGPLHIANVTLASETGPQGTATVLGLRGITGTVGPVQIVRGNGEARIPAGKLAVDLTLDGTMKIGEKTGPFRIKAPISLKDGKVVIGPKASISVPLGDGLRLDGSIALDLAPQPGKPIVVANGTITYGTMKADVSAQLRPGTKGIEASFETRKPIVLGSGLSFAGRLTYADNKVSVDGSVRMASKGAAGTVKVKGSLSLPKAGAAPRFALRTVADVELGALGQNIALGADLSFAGSLNGPISIDGNLVIAGTRVAVKGDVTLAGSEVRLHLTASGSGATGTIDLALNRSTGALTGTATLDSLTVGGQQISGVKLTIESGKDGTEVRLDVGRIQFSNGREAEVHGVLRMVDGVTQLAIDGRTNLLGPDLTVSGTVTLAGGRVDLDITAATGQQVVLGADDVTLSGSIHLTGNVFDELTITGDLDVVGNHVSIDGTVKLRDGGIDLTLHGAVAPSGTLDLAARYDLATKRLTGTVDASGLTFESVELTDVHLEVDLSAGKATIGVDAKVAIGENITVQVAGTLVTGGGTTRLDATGTATINNIEVSIAGHLTIDDTATTFDVTATATDVNVPLGGQNLSLTGSIHLTGTIGGTITIDAQLNVYGTVIDVTGTLEFTDNGLVLNLDATGDGVDAHASVTVADGNVDATVTINEITFGDVSVQDATLTITTANGELHATIAGNIVWDGSTFAVTGTVDRSADGTFTAALDGSGSLPVADGVDVTEVHLAYDGTTITLTGQAHVLTAKADARVSISGSVTLGDAPTFDLLTAADGTIALDDDERMAFEGALRFRNGDEGKVRIDGRLSAIEQTLAFTGTAGLENGAVAVHLTQTAESTVNFTFDLSVDIANRSGSGKLTIGNLTFGTDPKIAIHDATVEVTLASGKLTASVAGEAQIDDLLVVTIDAELIWDGDTITLQFLGQARMLDKFVDVAVGGAIKVQGGAVTFDIVAEANAGLDFNGSGDLFIDGGFRVWGTLGQPINIEGEISALENKIGFVGTFTGDIGNATLHLTETPGSTTTLLVDVTLNDGAVTAHINLGVAKLDVIEVRDLDLSGSMAKDGTTELTVSATAQLADPSGKLAGITDAQADLSGTYKRAADKTESLSLKATISRLQTNGEGLSGTFANLKLDYLDVELDISRAAAGEPVTVTISKAQLAATREGDTWVMPDTPEAEGNDRIDLTGTIRLSGTGKIEAWKLDGAIDQLTYGNFILSGTFSASGEGLVTSATAQIDVDAHTVDNKITGHLAGNVGYHDGTFVFDLAGNVTLDNVGGLDADIDLSLTGDGLLSFQGQVGFGMLQGDATGRMELTKLADGRLWPRIELDADAFGTSTTKPKKNKKVTKTAFGAVHLSNWEDPQHFTFSAGYLETGSTQVLAGFLADKSSLVSLKASGYLWTEGDVPSFDLTVRASGSTSARYLGFLAFIGAEGRATVRAYGNFEHVRMEARGMGVAMAGLGGGNVPIAGGGVDVDFSADLNANKVYEINATAHAGASVLGPVLTARADLRMTGTVDLVNKRATLNASANASANLLIVIARANATGTVSVDIDWATPNAEPVITGNARIDIDAHVAFWRVAGFHADLRYDGQTLWVTNGDKFLNGDGIIKRKRRVVNLRGTLYPNEMLCGDQQVKPRLAGWKSDGKWGDCGGRGTATGRVIEDTDGSGNASPGDLGVGAVPIDLRAADGTILESTVTEANGTWRFDDLGAGATYQLAATVPTDRSVVADPDGTLDAMVTFPINNGGVSETGTVVLTAVQAPGNGVLTGVVLDDVMADGSLDGDPPMADVQVRLSGPTNTTVRTDANGRWTAEGLTEGDYAVAPVKPLHSVTVDPDGTLDGQTLVTAVADTTVEVPTFGLHLDGAPPIPEAPLPEGANTTMTPTDPVPSVPTDTTVATETTVPTETTTPTATTVPVDPPVSVPPTSVPAVDPATAPAAGDEAPVAPAGAATSAGAPPSDPATTGQSAPDQLLEPVG